MADNADLWEPEDEGPPYAENSTIHPAALASSIQALSLVRDDTYLRMQATNLGVVDTFLMDLEFRLLKKRFQEERVPIGESAFLSAQTQMWIFAVYELLRTWRQRATNIVKWAKTGGFPNKIAALEKHDGYEQYERTQYAQLLRRIQADPKLVSEIRDDLKRTHMLFHSIEVLRVALAKHEVKGKPNSMAKTPGYGRVNQWCGAISYELSDGPRIICEYNRRDIADSIRTIDKDAPPPSDEDLSGFDAWLRGTTPPPPNDFGR